MLNKKGSNVMKLRRITLALSFAGVAAAGLAGCGGSSNDYPEIVSVEGTGLDGYLVNATVCSDVNGNKACDPDEPTTETDGAGDFELETSSDAPLLLVPTANTFDLTTGETFTAGEFFLTAPAGSANISPLTTLAQVQAEVEGGSYADAQASVVAALGLAAGTSLAAYDYVAVQAGTGADADRLKAAQMHVVAQTVRRVLSQNLATINAAGSGASSNVKALTAAYLVVAPPVGAGGTKLTEFVTQVGALAITANSNVATVLTTNSGTLNTVVSNNTLPASGVDDALEGIEDAVDSGGSGGDPIDGVTGGTGGSST